MRTDPKPAIERVVPSHDRLGETPLWCDRTQKLWWIDIEVPKIQSYEPGTGRHDVLPIEGTYLGSLALTDTARHLIAIDLSLLQVDPTSGALTLFAQIESGLDNRLNDGRVDADGRLWIGTMDNQLHRGNGSLYRVDPDGSVTTMLGDIIVSNGIAHSPDNRTLYLTDTRRFCTWAFDLDRAAGTISNRRLFADYRTSGDRPDGTCVDADGCLWTAFFAGSRVVRYRRDGTIDRTIHLPVTNPTCVCFGGRELKTLYITTARKFLSDDQLGSEPLAGSLLAVDGVGQGLPENRFGICTEM
jgi:sugar lactone lactonase YvrE